MEAPEDWITAVMTVPTSTPMNGFWNMVDAGKLRVVPQTVHGTRHDIHAVHQHRKPDHDKSQILPAAVPLEEAVLQYARNTQHRRENGHNIDTAAPVTQQRQGKQKRRDGSPHVGTHDDADRLRQRHDAGVDESDDHDRRGGGGLYRGGHDQPEQEALELIGSQFTENGLHLLPAKRSSAWLMTFIPKRNKASPPRARILR